MTPKPSRTIQKLLALLLGLSLIGCTPIEPPATAAPQAPLATTATSTAPAPRTLPTPVPTELPATPAPTGQPPAEGAFSGQRAVEDVRWLAETIGSRPAGSPAEQQAAEGLAERLRPLGYEVTLQPFPVSRFEDRGSRLGITERPELQLPVATLLNAASGSVSGPLVEAGLGRPEDLRGLALRGAIALVERGEITFGEKVANLAAAGALGAVIYNREPGGFRGAIPEPAAIPAVALSQEDGATLLAALAGGALAATLSVDAEVIESTSYNVVASLPGASDEVVVLGAHYDSVAEGPGANDNASGTATVLELARMLAGDTPALSVRVVFFGAEEIGLVGSRHYVEGLGPEERERTVAMFNFDMVGVGERALVGGSDALVALAMEQGTARGQSPGELGNNLDSRSDHGSFLAAGIPALFFHRSEDPRYHTADDQAAYVSAEHMRAAGELALDVFAALAETVPG
jgi:aminopeptidase YwaD